MWLLVFLFLSGLDESVLEECLQYLEKQLENSQVRKAMEEFFSFGYVLSLKTDQIYTTVIELLHKCLCFFQR